MNKDIKALWISALESGDYSQGRSYLNAKGRYCCLGVLCDLAEKAGVVAAELYYEDTEDEDDSGSVYSYDCESNMLPRRVIEWAGLNDGSGRLPRAVDWDDAEIGALWELNDVANYSFEEIASVIEEQF